jgi:methyltransferase (TIGR00027 family)
LHCPDNLSQVFLPFPARLLIGIPPLRRLFLNRLAPKGLPEYVLARTRIFDDAFVTALEEGFSQIVLLGAGFDTRPLRFDDRNHGTRIFELDMPKTQDAKLDVYWHKQVTAPENITFVPIDFDRQDIGDALRAAGYKDGEKTLFLWEGVTMYVTEEAVEGTLDFIGGSAASGSVLVFDYVRADVLGGKSALYGDRNAAKTVADAGEAWTFGLEEDEVSRLLSDHGLELRSHYTPEDMERMYFSSDGRVLRRVNGTHCIAVAAVAQ